MDAVSSKSPVVLVHGMWSTPDTLLELKQKFQDQGYVVHVPRLPYHYHGDDLTDECLENLKRSGIKDYVLAVEELVRSLETPPILVGHSMGGLISQIIASTSECEKLVLFSSAAPAGINSLMWTVMRTFGHNLFKLPMWKSVIELNEKIIAYGIANSQTKKVQQNILNQAVPESGLAAWEIAMWFFYRSPATKVDFSNVGCPVLVIGGNQDKITPIEAQRKIALKYGADATLLEIDGACHWTIGGSYLGNVMPKVFSWINKSKRCA